MDFRASASLCVVMSHADDNTRSGLIQHLLLEAGRLMEDASPEFALAPPDTAKALDARIAFLEAVAVDLQALAAAARTLFRLSTSAE